MKAFILAMVLGIASLSSLVAHPAHREEKTFPKATKERMDILKLLMDKELILTFVSHPQAAAYFHEERQRQELFIHDFVTELNQILQQYPADTKLQEIGKDCLYEMDKALEKFPYDHIVIPFLCLGIGNLQGIEDEKLIKDLQEWQVRLFKNSMSSRDIGYLDKQLTEELYTYSKNSPLPLMTYVVQPLLETLLKNHASLLELLEFYLDSGNEQLSVKQRNELECIYQAVPYIPQDGENPSFCVELDENSFLFEEDEDNNEAFPGLEALEALFERFRHVSFFSFEKTIEVFFTVMKEAYPESQAYFQAIQQGQTVENMPPSTIRGA